MTRLLIYVQHLLGTGHLVRVRSLAEAFAAEGFAVSLISGGFPLQQQALPQGVELIQLPPLCALPGDFTALVDEHGRPIDGDWKATRRDELLRHATKIRPHAAIIETYPFGRRQLRFELLPLMETLSAMRPKPLLTVSIRDVLQERTRARWQETADLVERFFDLVLVHGDPDLISLDISFPLAPGIAGKIRYTGYVYLPATAAAGYANLPVGEVLVSGGGGAVSETLLQCAVRARPLSGLHDAGWRLLAGHNLPEQVFRSLRAHAGEGVTVERNRADFPQLLERCRVSISQGGYNTVLDILHANAPAVIVPYAENGETEQTTRARRLQQLGRVVMLEERSLTPEHLAAAIDRAVVLDFSAAPAVAMDGIDETVRIVSRRLGASP